MVKNDLRDRGYYAVEKIPKAAGITTVWVILTVVIIAATFICAYVIVGDNMDDGKSDNMFAVLDENMMSCLFVLLAALFLYLALKLVITLLFCADKSNSVKLKFLESKAMPICSCREAFKVWQTVVIYLAPVVIIYLPMFIMCVYAAASAGVMIIIFFISFFLAFDLTLIIYVLYFKVKEKIEYISIDHHVYGVTFFNKIYIRENKKTKKH